METFARDPETSLPIFYIYDSYQIKPEDWYKEFSTLRNTEWDAYIVGLIVEGKGSSVRPGTWTIRTARSVVIPYTVNHLTTVLKSGFNAAYR